MKRLASFRIHPFATFLPCCTDEEYRSIRDDIRENGLKVPLLLFNGKLLDGRTRAKACDELGIQPDVQHINGPAKEALRRVQSLNVFRRHLTQSQKAAVADCISNELQKMDGITTKEARAIAAKATGAACGTIQKAAAIRQASPTLAKQIVNGEKTVTEAIREIRPSGPAIQAAQLCGSAVAMMDRSLAMLKQKSCPEKRWLERIVSEMKDLHRRLRDWAESKNGD